MIISNQMSTVNDHDQWRFSDASSVNGHFLQFVESPLDVQEWCGIPGTPDAEQTTNVAGGIFVSVLLLNINPGKRANKLTPHGIQNPMPSPAVYERSRDPHGLRIWQRLHH